MPANWKRLLLLPCALLSLAASGPDRIDATKVSCAQFQELGLNAQKRILSFLQGYARREVPEDKVGSAPVGAGLTRVLDACRTVPSSAAWSQVQKLAAVQDPNVKGDTRLTRQPTEMTCREYSRLSREDQRLTVDWLDGYSRKADPTDANQSVVDLRRNAESFAKTLCLKPKQRVWWAIKGGVRSIDPAPPSE